jgi:hypothetical protein
MAINSTGVDRKLTHMTTAAAVLYNILQMIIGVSVREYIVILTIHVYHRLRRFINSPANGNAPLLPYINIKTIYNDLVVIIMLCSVPVPRYHTTSVYRARYAFVPGLLIITILYCIRRDSRSI